MKVTTKMRVITIIKEVLPNSIYLWIRTVVFRSQVFFNGVRYDIFHLGEKLDIYKIPIIINNFNRLNFLKRLITSLEQRGYTNIIILDNCSTFPPLLEYYQKCPYRVIFLSENKGYLALWKSTFFHEIKSSYYVYTDSDLEIIPECPADFMSVFYKIMKKYPSCQKVGFGLKIDDLPDWYKLKQKVIIHETQFWQNEVEKDIFKANIDTTFALYRPYCFGPSEDYHVTYRTGGKYIVRHLPWYVNSNNLDDEETYYVNHISCPTWWAGKEN